MTRPGRLLLTLAAAALLGGCTQFGMFEDVGSDPHPPRVSFVGLFQVITTGEGAEAVTVTVPAPFDGTAYPVRPGTELALVLSWSDAGGDIVSFQIRDRDSALAGSFAPAKPDLNGDGLPDDELEAPGFFPGTGGQVALTGILIESRMQGRKRIEFWAVDSHESRSAKGEFLLNLVL